MPSVADLDLPELDFADPQLTGERFSAAIDGLLAAGHRLARSPLATIVLDHDLGERVLRSRAARFPGREIAELFGIAEGPLREQVDRNILHLHGEEHRRLRQLVNPHFTPKAADARRPMLRALLERLWEPLTETGRCDAIPALCAPYPAMAVATVMGAPVEDHARLAHFSHWIQKQFDPPALLTQRPQIEEAVAEFRAYCDALLARKREQPGDDLVTTLLAAPDLDDLRRRNLVLNVLVGGVDTTQAQLAHALLLAARDGAWPALDDVLRLHPITPFTARVCLEDLEHDDVTFPAGTIVLVCSWAANRQPGSRILTFGAGPHFCLGVNLARAELEEALAFLEPRMPRLRLDAEPAMGTVQGIYGIDALPVAWG
ncbi:MAG TPA: cytochrome P450 [Baekduia sp.]|nr:cytochrome P450 [Baekduia sp.]